MINGFVLDIINENMDEKTISLFTNKELPSGITISVRNADYDYKALYLMSITEGFVGGGIVTDDERISQVTIIKNNNSSTYEFHKILDNMEIIIDGLNNYITLTIPASSRLLVQLIPFVK